MSRIPLRITVPLMLVTPVLLVAAVPTSTFVYDPRVRPWYMAPTQAGRAAWCEPFVLVGGADTEAITLGISYGEPLFDAQGNLLGVIDTDLSLNDISNYLQRFQIGQSGQVYIVGRGGMIIGSSTGVGPGIGGTHRAELRFVCRTQRILRTNDHHRRPANPAGRLAV